MAKLHFGGAEPDEAQLPPSGLLESFSGTVNAVTDQLRTLCFQNQKLHAARDLLLPRLMSGEIEV